MPACLCHADFSFESLRLSERTRKVGLLATRRWRRARRRVQAIEAMGFQRMTEVQARCIPLALVCVRVCGLA